MNNPSNKLLKLNFYNFFLNFHSTDSFSDEEDEFIMAEDDGRNDNEDGIDQDDMRNLHIDGI